MQSIRSQENVNKDLAYIIGVYLGDGSINKGCWSFCLQTIDYDFAEHTHVAMIHLCRNSPVIREMNRKTSANRTVWGVYANDVTLCRSLRSITNQRKNLPKDFYEWPIEWQHSLIAGLLDSEGYVSISRVRWRGEYKICQMIIGIGATDPWMKELHRFLQSKGYKVGTLVEEHLPSGKINYKFSFNKRSFLEKCLYFTIGRKQQRVEEYRHMFSGSTTRRNLPILDSTRKLLSESKKAYWQRLKAVGNDIV